MPGLPKSRSRICTESWYIAARRRLLANTAAIATEQKYPLEIHGCRSCGLVQIVHPVDPEILFQDYSFSSSTIKPLVDHFDAYAEWLVRTLRPATVVESAAMMASFYLRWRSEVSGDGGRYSGMSNVPPSKGLGVITGYFDPWVRGRSVRIWSCRCCYRAAGFCSQRAP